MTMTRNFAAILFFVTLLSFSSVPSAKNSADCSAYSLIGPAVDQATAESDCEGWTGVRDCDADCEEDNTPESIHGSECNEFYWTIAQLNTCTYLGEGDFGYGNGHYAELKCTCFWDFPGN